MKTNLMRCFAVALGVSLTAVPYAHAQYGQAPQANAFGNGYLTATVDDQYSVQQKRQPAAGRWNNFNASPQQYGAPQSQSAAPQPQFAMPADQTGTGQQVFRQVAQQQDDVLLPPRATPVPAPEQIGPGIAQPNPHAQAPVQQQVPSRGSYQPAPAKQDGPAYETSPNTRQAPTYSQAPSQPIHQAPNQSNQPAPTYAPQDDPYSNAPSVNYPPSAPCESTILDPKSGKPGSGTHDSSKPNAPQDASPYSQAMKSPWDGGCGPSVPATFAENDNAGRPSLFPWFGGANALFFDTANSSNGVLAINATPALHANAVDPNSTIGYEVSAGRYLKCGTLGLGFTYFNWNPDAEQVLISGTAGNIRSAMQGHHDYHLDLGGGDQQVYAHIFGTAVGAGATNVRASRDLDVQGLEANLFSFGLMGYGRTTPACGTSGCGILGGLSNGSGFGRLGGPLTRPCANRIQIVTSHGLRWFQIEDTAQLAYNIDGTAGYQAQDIYDDVRVRNDLYGYQLGALLNYCISKKMNFNVGGKFGLYANDAEAARRVGTETQVAYRFGDTTDIAQTAYDDIVLATLGEVNAGLGYRLGNAWTVNGGYRVMGVSGIATAFDQMSQDFGTSSNPGNVHANDSLLLHGAYIGANFNW